MPPFKIIFAGTPVFAVKALEKLLQSQHSVLAVYTQPDKPAGRGQVLTPSPVKTRALEHHLPVFQPVSLKSAEVQQQLQDFAADIMVVAAYGLILPAAVLKIPRLGCINIHASLLPRFRGAAPIQRAILAGDKETGITIMQMDEGLDTGAMLYKMSCPITANDTSASLHDKLAHLGGEALLTALDNLSNITPQPQNNSWQRMLIKLPKKKLCLIGMNQQLSWKEKFELLILGRLLMFFISKDCCAFGKHQLVIFLQNKSISRHYFTSWC